MPSFLSLLINVELLSRVDRVNFRALVQHRATGWAVSMFWRYRSLLSEMGCQHSSGHNYNTVDLFGNILHFSVICIICRWVVLACLSQSDNNSLTYCCPVPLSLRDPFFKLFLDLSKII